MNEQIEGLKKLASCFRSSDVEFMKIIDGASRLKAIKNLKEKESRVKRLVRKVYPRCERY